MRPPVPRQHEDLLRVIAESLCRASERTGKDFGELEVTEWCAFFSGFGALELRQAFENVSLHSPFAPTMAAVRQELDRLRFGGVSGAWLMVQKTAGKCRGDDFLIVFEHPAIHFAVEVLGGWRTLIQLVKDSRQLGFTRTAFERAFRDYQPTLPYPAGLGSFDGCNAVLIGHRGRALGVYRGGVKAGQAFHLGADALEEQVRLHPGQRSRSWPDDLGPGHMAAPPGPPIVVSFPWEDQRVQDPQLTRQ